MSIITFWNNDKEQTGKTLTSVAVATRMAIERNFKVLLISTSYREATIKNCFWTDTIQKNLNLLGNKNSNNFAVENGIEGLSKLVNSNKIQPTIITDYTKVIFKGRLEVLNGYVGSTDNTEEESKEDYRKTSECYPELAKLANQYYDIVIIDIDNGLEPNIKQQLIDIANVNILVISQRLESLNNYKQLKQEDEIVSSRKCITTVGRYMDNNKYNKKNIMRYLEVKKDIYFLPYNTLFFEAAEEANVSELFLKLRDIKDKTDENYIFMDEVLKLTNGIIDRIQELIKKR